MMTEEGKTVIPHCPHNMCPTRGRFRLQGMHYRLSLGETPPLQKSVHSLCVRVLLCFWHNHYFISVRIPPKRGDLAGAKPRLAFFFNGGSNALHVLLRIFYRTFRLSAVLGEKCLPSRSRRLASRPSHFKKAAQRRRPELGKTKTAPVTSIYLQTGAPVYFVSAGSASWRRPTNVSPRGRVLRSLLMTW